MRAPTIRLESLIRRFVKDPVPAYKPKKGPETDARIQPILNRGLRYLSEYEVSGEKAGKAAADEATAKDEAD